MLALKEITKQYSAGAQIVDALRGITVGFRASEFVSILGPSGCGKTTLLNIIGGLDRYTSGDLVINGRSTTSFEDVDWNAYRNRSIGFVFQTYNLIPHQTVLTNVELALTISGVSKAERRRRAIESLERVGLGDQLNKRPNQLSGGQMQRVAIARAIVNNPEILLADEPTGALDTSTSVQIMEILKEIASDRLVIMVTHNPELAETYSSRIIRLKDGLITDDRNPYDIEEASIPVEKAQKKKKALPFWTATSLSLNNLLTKKARTLLTSLAGSIGIIGIALILALSAGINAYIADVQEDALSSYPLTITRETQDYSALMSAMVQARESRMREVKEGEIYVDDSMGNMLTALMSTRENNLTDFKAFLDAHPEKLEGAVSDIRYRYGFQMNVFSEDGKTQVNPSTIVESMGGSFAGMVGMMSSSSSAYASGYSSAMNVFHEMLDNTELLQSQYDVIAGKWTEDPHEVMLIVNGNNSVTNLVLYALGIKDQSEIPDLVAAALSGTKTETEEIVFSYDDFLGMTFYVVPNHLFYRQSASGKTYTVGGNTYPLWEDVRSDPDFDRAAFAKSNGIPITVCGIVRPNPDATSASMNGAIAFQSALSNEMMDLVRASDIAIQQTEYTPGISVFTGHLFEDGAFETATDEEKADWMRSFIQNRDEDKASVMLSYLSQSVSGLVDAEMETMEQPEKDQYLLMHLADLAKLSAADYKTVLLEVIRASLQDPSSPYSQNPDAAQMLAQYEAMDPDLFLKMTAALIAGDSSGESPAQPSTGSQGLGIDAMLSALSALPASERDRMVRSILEQEIQSENAKELLQAYTTAELIGLFDKTVPGLPVNEQASLADAYRETVLSKASFRQTLSEMGFVDEASPESILLYSKDFASKDRVTEMIADYNDSVGEADQIQYTDLVGILLSSVTTIINAISYVLIGFVSISLVVSSIMIGIITYISVLERTKEIGILRAIGASKRDISKVFNAETLIVGFCAGMMGILVSVLLCLPINAIIHSASGIESINAFLPLPAAVILVVISMLLTFLAGLIPAIIAACKDPVLALRTE
ncbi:MAG: ABC transporter ATP-binding protein/permease [Clostridia bacterium]|nr:ABC transporter ATP-binding protein/permease [Clostridia bacterium]